jgi:hypothetical protein
MQIGNTGEVAFDALVAASERAVDLWSKSHACQTCTTSLHERFLSIYNKLIDLLEDAVTKYTSLSPSLSNVHSTASMSDRQASRRPSSQHRNDGQESIASIVCRPSVMSLGEYELNEQQSRHLAFELIARKLKSLATILRQMLDQDENIDEMKTKVDTALSRVWRLLSTVHRRLVLVQASSVRKTDDIALDTVDADEYKSN